LHTEAQLDVLSELAPFVHDSPFARESAEASRPEHRYHLDNPFFGPTDGLIAQAFLRSRRPSRVVEVGSGYSSALMLDIDDLYLENRTRFTFVDPYPERLESLLAAGDETGERVTVLRHEVQDVDLAIFDELEPGDLLFIDSSHVVRCGSDVNLLLLEVVPALKPGILVHVHDVGWPFEYSREWIEEGRYWTEGYLLQALLVGNAALTLELWMGQLLVEQNPQVVSRTPELADPAVGWGTSVWLRTR
jgi:predicted O-methyltransferase YrrM